MALNPFTKDLNIMAKVPVNPAEGGFNTETFRAEFDKAGLEIQKYINDEIVPNFTQIVANGFSIGDEKPNGPILWLNTVLVPNGCSVVLTYVDEYGTEFPLAPETNISLVSGAEGVPITSDDLEPDTVDPRNMTAKTLFVGHDFPEQIAPITKTTAVYDENGTRLDVLLNTLLNSTSKPLDAYPVGSIYLSVNSTSPASLFGGTWTQLKDRFLLGAGSTYSNGATGGASTVTLTLSQIPAHTHNLVVASDYNDGSYSTNQLQPGKKVVEGANKNQNYTNDNAIKNAGGSGSHNNMPPYLVVYMWKRTA